MMDKAAIETEVRSLEKMTAVLSLSLEKLLGGYAGPEVSQAAGNYANLLRYSVSDVERRVKALRDLSSLEDQPDPRETPSAPS